MEKPRRPGQTAASVLLARIEEVRRYAQQGVPNREIARRLGVPVASLTGFRHQWDIRTNFKGKERARFLKPEQAVPPSGSCPPRPAIPNPLGEREREIREFVAAGKRNKEIAYLLGVSLSALSKFRSEHNIRTYEHVHQFNRELIAQLVAEYRSGKSVLAIARKLDLPYAKVSEAIAKERRRLATTGEPLHGSAEAARERELVILRQRLLERLSLRGSARSTGSAGSV